MQDGQRIMGAVAMPYDVFAANCPTRLVLDRLADKWALLVLERLRGETVRFNRLRRDVEGVSQKVLSQTLKRLERDGLVARTVIPTVPVTVEYALTPLGLNLADTVSAFAHWAERNIEAILAAQAAYDGRGGAGA
ncbi:winged helix-turn-helix transcriptional regulator [Antarcticirhabdus aurantiaca]|uniref:winged helix-turn-helix transcriptional regulator n=1 Tax=Antarcticirhabdus aurantiaca TaxID=2606717 RepID=UPI003BB5C113